MIDEQARDKEYLRCLVQLDAPAMRALFRKTDPHLPQPRSDEEAMISIHMARAATPGIPQNLRIGSHLWLTKRQFPSALSHEQVAQWLAPTKYLVPDGDQKIVTAVGIAIGDVNGRTSPILSKLREAIEHKVLEMYADGDTNPYLLQIEMRQVETKERVRLGLRRRNP